MTDLLLYIRPNAKRAAIIDDLLSMAAAGQQAAVDAAITMLADLHQNGRDSSFAKKLQGQPVWELKTHARGGIKGGTRVYFYFRGGGAAVIVNAETKKGDTASVALLVEAKRVFNQDNEV